MQNISVGLEPVEQPDDDLLQAYRRREFGEIEAAGRERLVEKIDRTIHRVIRYRRSLETMRTEVTLPNVDSGSEQALRGKIEILKRKIESIAPEIPRLPGLEKTHLFPGVRLTIGPDLLDIADESNACAFLIDRYPEAVRTVYRFRETEEDIRAMGDPEGDPPAFAQVLSALSGRLGEEDKRSVVLDRRAIRKHMKEKGVTDLPGIRLVPPPAAPCYAYPTEVQGLFAAQKTRSEPLSEARLAELEAEVEREVEQGILRMFRRPLSPHDPQAGYSCLWAMVNVLAEYESRLESLSVLREMVVASRIGEAERRLAEDEQFLDHLVRVFYERHAESEEEVLDDLSSGVRVSWASKGTSEFVVEDENLAFDYLKEVLPGAATRVIEVRSPEAVERVEEASEIQGRAERVTALEKNMVKRLLRSGQCGEIPGCALKSGRAKIDVDRVEYERFRSALGGIGSGGDASL